jgi:CRP/FNR family cyclic AMP-dependent transcriptional regulator
VTNLLELTGHQPSRSLADGEILIVQGEHGGDLFILEKGKLTIERDGVTLATVSIPGSVIGEISVLTGTSSSATARALGNARVRVIRDAALVLEQEPQLTLRLAGLVASRLEATSSELVALSRDVSLKSKRNVLARLAAALHPES